MCFRFSAALVLALAGAISISCGGIVDPSQNQSQTFTGQVQPGGSSAQKFSSPKTGEIAVKVGTLTPASTQFIGVEWVQAGDGSCNGAQLFNNQFGFANTTPISTQITS